MLPTYFKNIQMDREKIIEFLVKFNYKFTETNQIIAVKLEFAQIVYIDLSEPNKVKLTDKLTGWNFLTGMVTMSLKDAMIYNFVGGILVGVALLYLSSTAIDMNLNVFYLLFIFWVIPFIVYYTVKLESFKTRIMNLLN